MQPEPAIRIVTPTADGPGVRAAGYGAAIPTAGPSMRAAKLFKWRGIPEQ